MALNLLLTVSQVYVLLPFFTGKWPRDTRGAIPIRPTALLGLSLGLVFLVRLDNLFLIIMLCLAFLNTRRIGARQGVGRSNWMQMASLLLPLGLIILAYGLLSLGAYGAIIPVSGQVKHYWHSIGGSVFGPPPDGALASITAYLSRAPSSTVSGPVAGLVRYWSLPSIALPVLIGGLAYGLLRTRHILRGQVAVLVACLFGGSLLHLAYYVFSGHIQSREWYWVPEYVTFLLLLAFGLNGLLSSQRSPLLRWALAVIAMLTLLVARLPTYLGWIFGQYQYQPADGSDYLERAAFLEQNTPATAVIGTPNAGGLGYLTRRRIVNIDGLVNSYAFLTAMRSEQSDRYLDQIGVDFIFIGPGYTEYEPYAHMLNSHLDLVASWSASDGSRPHDLFRFQLAAD
jgi:hypothetical protein